MIQVWIRIWVWIYGHGNFHPLGAMKARAPVNGLALAGVLRRESPDTDSVPDMHMDMDMAIEMDLLGHGHR